MDFRYLKDNSYYNDLYDLLTVKDCIDTYWSLRKGMEKRQGELKDMTPEKFDEELNKVLSRILYVRKGERFREKRKTLDEWIARDKVKQDKYDNTSEPQNTGCPKCGALMKVSVKHLEDYTDQPLRVLFFFDCPKCKTRKGIYDDGEAYTSKPVLCVKCGKVAKSTHKRKGQVITWTTKCPSCGHREVDIDDMEKSSREWKAKEEKDTKLLEQYRKEFCLSDKDGQEYIEFMEKLDLAKQIREEARLKYESPVYQKVIHLKKLTIVELEKLLNGYLEKNKYLKLSLDKPQIDQFVIVPFTVQDADSAREDYESRNQLQKLVKDKLDGTNWRLLSNSIIYRLGYLSGQLKGYERQEDLIKLEQTTSTEKPRQSKVDEKLRMKYSGDPLIHLARMEGEFEATENLRKERLKKEPEGFALGESEGTYNCRICYRSVKGKEAWWDLNGIKCLDCQRNIKEGVIPAEICHNDNIWMKDWQIENDYSLHPATVRKLTRQGVLKGRELKTKSGETYFTLYLIKENQEFINKFTKKPKLQVEFTNLK